MIKKLPRIYLPLFGGHIDTSDDEPEMVRAFVREADAINEHCAGRNRRERSRVSVHGGQIAAYEPAVPRCKTCSHHRRESRDDEAQIDGYWYCEIDQSGECDFLQDGSGYCHAHPDARHP
jgi:hypothetical protein